MLFNPNANPLTLVAEYLASSDDSCSLDASSSYESILSISDREFAFILLFNVVDALTSYFLGICDSLKLIPPPILLLLGIKF